MKIISFGVNNFRCISGGMSRNTIDFNESNTLFIFGQNNVGKSTFLKAYEFFYKNESPTEDDVYKKTIDGKIELELVVELDADDFERIQEVAPNKLDSLKKYLKDEKLLKIRREYQSKQEKNKTNFEKVKNLTWVWETENWDEKCYGGIGLDGVFQACLPKPIFIKAMPTESEVEDIVNEILSEKAKKALKDKEHKQLKEAQAKIKELQEKMYNPKAVEEYKVEVNKHFGKLFPDTEINFSDKDKVSWTESKFGKKFDIHFEKKDENGEKDENIPSSYENIGHGAVRSAIFTLLLMRDIAEEFERKVNRKDYIVLFEEPELFLHPKLMKELRALIYKVSEEDFPYQVLCASHSPQMVDLSKPKSSLIRMIKSENKTQLFQVNDSYLKKARGVSSDEELKQEMYEVLRFNPFMCESFYSDEVILIEGPTEEIIIRGYLEEMPPDKDVFIVNCGTVNNIPFYQKIFSQFSIKYNIICDLDTANEDGVDTEKNPILKKNIQGSIYTQLAEDYKKENYTTGLLRVHKTTFEPAHKHTSIPEKLRFIYDDASLYPNKNGKPMNANLYWKNILQKNLSDPDISKVPIIKYLKEIL